MLFHGFYCWGEKVENWNRKRKRTLLNLLTSRSSDERRREQNYIQPNFISATTYIDQVEICSEEMRVRLRYSLVKSESASDLCYSPLCTLYLYCIVFMSSCQAVQLSCQPQQLLSLAHRYPLTVPAWPELWSGVRTLWCNYYSHPPMLGCIRDRGSEMVEVVVWAIPPPPPPQQPLSIPTAFPSFGVGADSSRSSGVQCGGVSSAVTVTTITQQTNSNSTTSSELNLLILLLSESQTVLGPRISRVNSEEYREKSDQYQFSISADWLSPVSVLGSAADDINVVTVRLESSQPPLLWPPCSL